MGVIPTSTLYCGVWDVPSNLAWVACSRLPRRDIKDCTWGYYSLHVCLILEPSTHRRFFSFRCIWSVPSCFAAGCLQNMSPKNPYGGAGPMTLAISWTQAAIAIILVLLRAFAARSHADRLRWDFVYVAIGTVRHGLRRGIAGSVQDRTDALYRSLVLRPKLH